MEQTHAAAGHSRAWPALGLLLAAYTFSWLDRYVFAILLEPIRQDLGVTDWQMGLLTGFGFTLAYSIAGFPFARWADRGSRSTIIALTMAAWSLVTVLSGFAGSFAGLALARSGVAVCEAGCSPAAHSLISDLFPRHRRGLAFAIYGLGIPLGIWLGLSLGGVIGQHFGWRWAFVALGLPGIAVALVVRLHLREPVRGHFDHGSGDAARLYGWREGFAVLWRCRAFCAVVLGLSLLSFNGSGVQVWVPTFLLRAGAADLAMIGVMTGTVNGIGGVVGTVAAGLLADRFALRDPRAYLWIAAGAGLVLAPAELVFLAVSGWLRLLAFIVMSLALASYTAPLFSVAQMLLPPRLRAFGAATLLFVLNLLGPGAGPAFIGVLSGGLGGAGLGSGGLGQAIAWSTVAIVPALLCLGYAAGRLRRDLRAS